MLVQFKRWLPYFGVVIPWMVVGMPIGLAIPILILDIPLLNVPFYHKIVDIVVLLAVSLVLGIVFTALDAKLGYIGALREHKLRKGKET